MIYGVIGLIEAVEMLPKHLAIVPIRRLLINIGILKLGKSVKVEVSKDGVEADLSIELVYGYNIPETCSKVQDRVRTAIENMTGLEAKEINIRVAGVGINE